MILVDMVLAAPAAARDPARVLMPTDPQALAQQSQHGYAEAVTAGDMIYLSGVVAGPVAGLKSLRPWPPEALPTHHNTNSNFISRVRCSGFRLSSDTM